MGQKLRISYAQSSWSRAWFRNRSQIDRITWQLSQLLYLYNLFYKYEIRPLLARVEAVSSQWSSKELPLFGPRIWSIAPWSHLPHPLSSLGSAKLALSMAWRFSLNWRNPGESFGHLDGRASSAVIFWTCTKWSPNVSSSHIFWGDVFDPPYNPQQAQLQNFGQVWLVCFHNTTLAIACAAIAKVSQVHRPRPFSWRDQASYRGQRLPPLPFGGPLALCLQSIGEERRILGEHRELKNPQVRKWPKIEHLNF